MMQKSDLIDERAVEERFVRSSGPGGQNVNKVATAVQLRFDVSAANLTEAVKRRLLVRAGARATKEGVIIIEASSHRTQERNRVDARDRLARLIEAAQRAPKHRVKTRPTLASKRRRIEAKKQRSAVKKGRGRVTPGD
ncbi:MAG: aminoacyl-tRNA hydrolase [Alphaproteobacteria bacterium]|nr:aminoacyl-tRNA hydrolase [Alphaproteobacteria bacterium]